MSREEVQTRSEPKTLGKFSEEVLEHIAELIANLFSGSGITRFFRAAGYPEFIHDGSTKKWFALDCLRSLNERQDGPFHVAKVIEKLADPKQHIGAPDGHRSTVETLNQALVFHGLRLNADNKVVLSDEPVPTTPPPAPAGTSEVALFDRLQLHAEIQKVSRDLYKDGYYAQAILEAFKALNNAVKAKSGLSDRDGQALMSAAFSGTLPPLALNSLQTQSERDEQDGFKFIFMGAMTGIRNPKAHENVVQRDAYRTLHYLSLASLLMARLDEASRTSSR